MKDTCTIAAQKTEAPGIGKAAAKRRMKLQQLEERRRRTITQLNTARAELAQSVAEAEARDRRRMRNQQLQQLKRLKFVLGGLVLTAMREVGPAGLSMSYQDLDRLTDKDRQLLEQVWAVITASPEAAGSPGGRSALPGGNAVDTSA